MVLTWVSSRSEYKQPLLIATSSSKIQPAVWASARVVRAFRSSANHHSRKIRGLPCNNEADSGEKEDTRKTLPFSLSNHQARPVVSKPQRGTCITSSVAKGYITVRWNVLLCSSLMDTDSAELAPMPSIFLSFRTRLEVFQFVAESKNKVLKQKIVSSCFLTSWFSPSIPVFSWSLSLPGYCSLAFREAQECSPCHLSF